VIHASVVPIAPSPAARKPSLTQTAIRSPSRTFFTRPRPMSQSPSLASGASNRSSDASDGTKSWKRLIGPAIWVGKNAEKTWNFEKLWTGTSPR
jgi:hypothetical protein